MDDFGRSVKQPMIDVSGKRVDECGWAGPLLWVCTVDDYSIHLYDAPIELNGNPVAKGDDLNAALSGTEIAKVTADETGFSVAFNSGDVLSVGKRDIETARVFKRRGLDSHDVYQDGELGPDRD